MRGQHDSHRKVLRGDFRTAVHDTDESRSTSYSAARGDDLVNPDTT